MKTMEVSVIKNTTRDRSKSLAQSRQNPSELTKTIAHSTEADQKSSTERNSAISSTSGQLLKEAKVISSFSTGLENLTAVACYGSREAWLSRETKVNVNARTVSVVREEKTEILIQVAKGWHPCKLFCTLSGDILVAMFTSDDKNHKIVRYNEGKII